MAPIWILEVWRSDNRIASEPRPSGDAARLAGERLVERDCGAYGLTEAGRTYLENEGRVLFGAEGREETR